MLCTCLQFTFLLGGPTMGFSVCELSPADVNVSVASQFINEPPFIMLLYYRMTVSHMHIHTHTTYPRSRCLQQGWHHPIASCCMLPSTRQWRSNESRWCQRWEAYWPSGDPDAAWGWWKGCKRTIGGRKIWHWDTATNGILQGPHDCCARVAQAYSKYVYTSNVWVTMSGLRFVTTHAYVTLCLGRSWPSGDEPERLQDRIHR